MKGDLPDRNRRWAIGAPRHLKPPPAPAGLSRAHAEPSEPPREPGRAGNAQVALKISAEIVLAAKRLNGNHREPSRPLDPRERVSDGVRNRKYRLETLDHGLRSFGVLVVTLFLDVEDRHGAAGESERATWRPGDWALSISSTPLFTATPI